MRSDQIKRSFTNSPTVYNVFIKFFWVLRSQAGARWSNFCPSSNHHAVSGKVITRQGKYSSGACRVQMISWLWLVKGFGRCRVLLPREWPLRGEEVDPIHSCCSERLEWSGKDESCFCVKTRRQNSAVYFLNPNRLGLQRLKQRCCGGGRQ